MSGAMQPGDRGDQAPGGDCGIDCTALRRRLAEVDGDPDPAARAEAARIREQLSACPECADTVRADELFRQMLSRRCGERAPDELRARVRDWIQHTCYSQTTVEETEDGSRIVRHHEVRRTRYFRN